MIHNHSVKGFDIECNVLNCKDTAQAEIGKVKDASHSGKIRKNWNNYCFNSRRIQKKKKILTNSTRNV